MRNHKGALVFTVIFICGLVYIFSFRSSIQSESFASNQNWFNRQVHEEISKQNSVKAIKIIIPNPVAQFKKPKWETIKIIPKQKKWFKKVDVSNQSSKICTTDMSFIEGKPFWDCNPLITTQQN